MHTNTSLKVRKTDHSSYWKDVLVYWVLKHLLLLHLTHWLLRDVYCTDKGSLPQSVRQWQG